MRECPEDCPAKGKGALAHVENPDCVWRGWRPAEMPGEDRNWRGYKGEDLEPEVEK